MAKSNQHDKQSGDAWHQRARRVVLKFGSSILVREDGTLNTDHMHHLVEQAAAARARGLDVVIVSSGSIAAGFADLGLARRPSDLPSLQAAAAAGQARLIGLYRDAFAAFDIPVAQILMTHDVLKDRERHLNARNTLSRLLEAGVIPIVNENDTVAIDEICFGDNDHLAALVGMLVGADVVFLLTTTDGLLSAPPDKGGTRIANITNMSPDIRACVNDANTPGQLGTGGMGSKLTNAEMIMNAGEYAVIADGREQHIITRLLDGEDRGTTCHPTPQKIATRKRWIAFFDHPKGDITVDAGAAAALCERGSSLLAIGITRVDGTFPRGTPVRILNPDQIEIARGLSNFDAADVQRVKGKHSTEIAALLGSNAYLEVVHRDNLVLMG